MATLQEIETHKAQVRQHARQVLMPLAHKYQSHAITQADVADALNDACVPTLSGLPRWGVKRAGEMMRDLLAESGQARQCDVSRREKGEAKAQEVLEVLAPMLKGYQAGHVTLSELADELNDRGIRTVSGLAWNDKSVSFTLAKQGIVSKEFSARQKSGYNINVAGYDKKREHDSGKHLCHGWIDSYGHKHPCKHKRKIIDYRCEECWSLTRQG